MQTITLVQLVVLCTLCSTLIHCVHTSKTLRTMQNWVTPDVTRYLEQHASWHSKSERNNQIRESQRWIGLYSHVYATSHRAATVESYHMVCIGLCWRSLAWSISYACQMAADVPQLAGCCIIHCKSAWLDCSAALYVLAMHLARKDECSQSALHTH